MGALSDILRDPRVQGALAPVVNRVLGRTPAPMAAPPSHQAPHQAQPQQEAPDPLDLLSDPQKYAQALSQAGAPAPYVLSRVSELVKQQKELAGLKTTQLENKQKAYEQAGNILEGYMQAPTPENWKATFAALKDAEPEVHGMIAGFDPDKGAQPTEAQLAPVLGMTLAHARMVAQAKTKAETAEATARLPGVQADSAIKQIELGYVQGVNPAKIHSDIADAIDKAGGTAKDAAAAISAADLAFNSTLDPKAKAAAAGAAAAKVIEGLNSTNTAVRTATQTAPIHTAEAVDTANKLAPIKVKEAKDTLVATAGLQESISQHEADHRNALEQGDTGTAKYFESLTAAEKAQATANTIQRVVQLARSGSPLASQQLKAMVPEFTNAAQDIKRMGGSQSVNISSELDAAIAQIKSLTGNETLSKDTIDSIAPFVGEIAAGAIQQHNANVKALAKAYPQKKFSEEKLPTVKLKAPDGTIQDVPLGQADHYKQLGAVEVQ